MTRPVPDEWSDLLEILHKSLKESPQQLKEEIETNPNFATDDRPLNSVLDLAICRNDVELAEAVIQAGADVNLNDGGFNPLSIAIDEICRDSGYELVQVLLKSGADPNGSRIFDWRPLHVAAAGNDVELARILIQHGADVNQARTVDEFETPLMVASQNGHVDMIRFLLQNGADRFYRSAWGETCISVAAESIRNDIERIIERAIRDR